MGQNLRDAIAREDSAAVSDLLATGADPDRYEDNELPHLAFASRRGSVPIVRLLLNAKADPDARSDSGGTPLLEAVAAGHGEVALLLLDARADVDGTAKIREKTGEFVEYTPLMMAAKLGDTGLVRMLIDHGANVNSQARAYIVAKHTTFVGDGKTPLMYAVISGSTEIVRMLLDHRAKIGTREESNFLLLSFNLGGGFDAPLFVGEPVYFPHSTAFHLACVIGDTAMMRLLLDAGADIEMEDGLNYSPIHLAIHFHNPGAAGLLILRGAALNGDADDFSNTLACAASRGEGEIFRMLLSSRLPVNQTIGELKYPILFWAIMGGSRQIVVDLIDAGARPDALSKDRTSAAMVAASGGRDDLLGIMIHNGVNINLRNRNGETALILAAQNGHVDCVMTLLLGGADVNAKDDEGGSALSYAEANGHKEVIELLLKSTAGTNGAGREDQQ
jgi:ankyrin repeat protein